MGKKLGSRVYSNLVMGLLIIICVILSKQFILLPINGEESIPLENSWTYTNKSVTSPQQIKLPTSTIYNPKASAFTLYNTLPNEFFMGATLLIKANHQTLEVFLEDELIYSYGVDVISPIGKSLGTSLHFVRLPSDFAGKDISIRFNSKYPRFNAVADQIYIGTKSAHVFSVYRQNIVAAFIGISMFLIGLIVVIVYLIVFKLSGKSRVVVYLALISILSGIFILSSNDMLQLVWNAPLCYYQISVLSLFLLPLPILYFFTSPYVLGKVHILRIAIVVHRTFVITSIVLHLLHIVDFNITIRISHVLMICEFTLCAYYCAKNRRKKVAKTVLIAFTVLGIFGFTNIILFTINPIINITSFSKYGMLIFVIMISFHAGQYIFNLSRSSAMNSALAQIAYNDTMTGLKNRASFQEKLDYYEANAAELDGVAIAVADLNYLKCINDSLGHKKGDDLIIQCACVLERHFGKLGTVYRIGGDEFVVIMPSTTPVHCNEALNAMKRSIKSYNKSNPTSGVLSIAIGVEYFNRAYDNTINDLFSRADSAMYSNKIAQKERKVNIVNGKKTNTDSRI